MSYKRLIIYSGITVFCGMFSAVYEHFSHGVYSNYMVYLFTIPLVLGVVPELISRIVPALRAASPWAKLLQNFAIATLAIGSALQGVVEIYGTISPYILYYFGAGISLLLASVITLLICLLSRAQPRSS